MPRDKWILAVLLLIFALTALTVSLVQRSRYYATSPASEWILLGGLTSSSVEFRILWPSAAGTLTVSVNQDLTDPVAAIDLVNTGDEASSSSSHNIQAVTVINLESDTVYYYGVVSSSNDIFLRGKLRTPAVTGNPWNFTIALGGCAATGSRHKVFDEIAADAPDLFVHLGDFHYEDIGENNLQKRLDAIGTVLASPSQANLFRNTALVYMWDDHDWLGNNAMGFEEDEVGARETALESYQIAFPHYPLVAALNTTTSVSPYQAFTIGTVRFILTDLRSESTNENIYSDEQRTWLRTELSQAGNYDFIVWITTKPWIGVEKKGDDSWRGHADERSDLSDWIANEIGGDGPQNLLAVSADAHMLAFDDGTNTFYGTSSSDGAPIDSFPILQSGPLDQYGSAKGGPFTEGCTSTAWERNHHYSTIAFQVPADDGEGMACMDINAYRVGYSKKQVFSKRLCGKIFQPSQVEVRQGTCDIKTDSTASVALFWVAVALTILESVWMLCCYQSKTEGMVVTIMIWVGLFLTFAFGIAIPFAVEYPYVDKLPTMILVTVQAFVVAVYLLYLSRPMASKDETSYSDTENNHGLEQEDSGNSNDETNTKKTSSNQQTGSGYKRFAK